MEIAEAVTGAAVHRVVAGADPAVDVATEADMVVLRAATVLAIKRQISRVKRQISRVSSRAKSRDLLFARCKKRPFRYRLLTRAAQ